MSPSERLRVVPGGPDVDVLEAAFAADRWDAGELGVPAHRGRDVVRFTGIPQPWLRDATKAWCRWRLATGTSFSTIITSTATMSRFSSYLAARCPDPAAPVVIDRALLDGYIAWLTCTQLAASTRGLFLICLRVFLDHNRRHRWLSEVTPDATIYEDELPKRPRAVPRFVSEFVMNQLENEANLAVLEPTTRRLVTVLIETGLRAGDAVELPFNPLVDDSVGWPCLRYIAGKTRVEQLTPLSVTAANAIEAQQADVTRRYPNGSRWLFPDPRSDDGVLPYPYSRLQAGLRSWQTRIDLHDERGHRVHVSSHQFRHTLGTRLINAGVPQHVVQRVLGHASPEMTVIYAQLHDDTVRRAFEGYQATRVDVTGELVPFDPAAPTATAEWVKHQLHKVQATLPNGYCGRPPQQDCPHPNACLTCPDFQTTVEFLDIHRRHAESTTVAIAAAEAKGNQRLAANHRRVHDNLTHIIDALETATATVADTTTTPADGAT